MTATITSMMTATITSMMASCIVMTSYIMITTISCSPIPCILGVISCIHLIYPSILLLVASFSISLLSTIYTANAANERYSNDNGYDDNDYHDDVSCTCFACICRKVVDTSWLA